MVLRKTSEKPLKSITNKTNYSAFDSGRDVLSHALIKKIDKFDKNHLFLGGGWALKYFTVTDLRNCKHKKTFKTYGSFAK